MNIFNSLVSKIFGASTPTPPTPAAVESQGSAALAVEPTAAPTGKPTVDVAQVLTQMAADHKEKLNWKQSIVDLMKLVGIDSSLTARKTLAAELGYTGDTNDSASMNIWLHKQVMTKLAENGGVVPAELL
jgi:hypothetical protein